MARIFTFCTPCKQLIAVLTASLLFTISFAQNPIVTENAQPGNPIAEWGVPDFRDTRIAGFSTKMSLTSGETVRFKITVQPAATYTIKIYRLGYYAGNGARLVQNLGAFNGVAQPVGISDAVTGILDCSNWAESASWSIPAAAVSGLYIAKLERTGGGSNHIAFIVRNDASNSDLYLQFPDATWQAYNGYGGNSLYDGNTGFPNGHAVKVSYNRPFFPYNSLFNTDGREADWYMNAIYPMIRWVERNGYDITYTSCNDVENNGARLLNHKIFISAGHDEYWSKDHRNNVEAARDAGVHLAFFSGNEVYWKTRWEANDGTEDRVLVCYKEGFLGDGTLGERTCGSKCDVSSTEWTGLWRTGAGYDAGRPENGLTGQISWDEIPGAIQVPSKYKKIRFWRNTSIPNLANGQTATLAPNTLGHEWDFEQYSESYPAGRITMSSTTINNHTHKLSLYRHPGGALVFGAGTVQWSWGLDGNHYGGTSVVSSEMQQATVNLFADMDVQPATLQAGLVPATKSTDLSAPSSSIVSPVNGATTPAGVAITVSGTATDASGVVAGVEVSTDGGITWKQAEINVADGSITWTFSWSPTIEGPATIKTRAFDDNGNKEVPGAGVNVTILPAVCPCTIFTPASVPAKPLVNDGSGGISLGVKFRTTQNGFITGIRYYKGAGATGTHTGGLWSSTGTQLATAVFINETASGWQQVLFSAPVPVTAGITYVASYHSSSGDYAATNPFFTQPVINSSLRALANGEDGPNGLFSYSATPVFPTNGFQSTNYWVDVVYTRASNAVAPVVTVQPTAQTVCAGKNVSFSSAGSGTPAPTVQWQSSINGTTWTNINGAFSSTLSFTPAITDNNKRYRAVWTNTAGSVNSTPALLIVNAIPAAPVVNVTNNCGNSVLTATSFTGSLLWSNGAVTPSITVQTAGSHSVTQTIKGCISAAGSKIASPKPTPVLSGSLVTTVNGGTPFIYNPASSVAGTAFTWSRAAVPGIKNSAVKGTGNISETLVNTTQSPVKVTYVYTLIANGCSNQQNLVVTVNAANTGSSCVTTTAIQSDFNSTPIPGGRHIWFNSSFTVNGIGKLKKNDEVIIVVTNSQITFKANNKAYTLKVPDARIRFGKNVIIANTRFIDNIWETVVPVNFNKDVFMTGLAYAVPANLPGNIKDLKWTANISIDKKDISLSWIWGAAVYSKFAGNTGLKIKPVSGLFQNLYLNTDDAGTPENFKLFVVAGATGKGKNNYTGDHSKKEKIDCKKNNDDDDHDKSLIDLIRKLSGQLTGQLRKQLPVNKLDVQAAPNPTNNSVNLSIHGEVKHPVTVSILDIFGQVIEKHERIGANAILKVGERWKNGIYFAVVVQGNQQKVIKIIKAN
jgi:hypothetical protein